MSFVQKRLGTIIDKASHSSFGPNINGPCCIKAPSWISNPLGRYLLYFSSHSGSHIYVCYADQLDGNWSVYPSGVLSLDEFNDAYDHIASPDILIDEKNKRLIMYFHARSHTHGREQWSFAASSSDGVNFAPLVDSPIAPFYLKTFSYRNSIYGITKGGNLWRSLDGISPFEQLGNPYSPDLANDMWHNDPGCIRHVGLLRMETILHIVFSRIGDKPEHILYSKMDLSSSNPYNWSFSNTVSLVYPETIDEGVNIPPIISTSGPSLSDENALRDPHLLLDEDKLYLFYSIRGESGIAASIINFPVI